MALGDVLTERNEADPIAKRLRGLALWKVSFSDEVPEYISEYFEGKLGANAFEPETFELLAQAHDQELAKFPEPPEVEARLRPYRLLNSLQQEAPNALDPDTLESILKFAAECEPLLRSALREWAGNGNTLDDKTLRLLLAILGEISGPDATDELLEMATWHDTVTLLHANWALYRLQQRFPSAVRDRLRCLAPDATLSQRCAIAEQINLAEPEAGDAELLLSLLADLKEQKSSDDAPYLLASVIYTLFKRDEPKKAKELGKFESLFTGTGREVVRAALHRDDTFLPLLEQEDVAPVTFEEVVLERALMDDEDEEDDELTDEELEEELDLEPPVRPGRNDPCWCGSGKKYKKCHLSADEEADRLEREAEEEGEPPADLHALVIRKVLKASSEWHKESDLRRAKRYYFDEDGMVDATEDELGGFLHWLMHDFRDAATRQTAIENYLRTRGNTIPPAERELLESLRDSHFGLFEVERIEPGSGVHVHDLFAGDRMFVHDISMSNSIHRWDCLLARVQFLEGRWLFTGNGDGVPRDLLDTFMGIVTREAKAAKRSPVDFLRANSNRWHREARQLAARRLAGIKVVNREGEEVSLGKSEYEVSDEAALLARLRNAAEIEEGSAEVSPNPWFTWLPEIGGERRPMGHLELEDGRLRLEGMSRTRLQTLRGMVEALAGDLLKHRGDHYTSMEEIKASALSRAPAAPGPPPTEEMQKALALAISAHYATWPDDKLPALGGKSAREAVRTKAGRQSVIDLLRTMENAEERKRRLGEPAYDFNIIRRELGLLEE
jgi:hypothetical protein